MKSKLLRLAALAGIYGLCIALASALWRSPLVLFGALVLISILMLYRWHEKRDVAFYFLALALGPLGEIGPVRFGAWAYSEPFYFIPIWLPLLWGIAALFLRRFSETLAEGA